MQNCDLRCPWIKSWEVNVEKWGLNPNLRVVMRSKAWFEAENEEEWEKNCQFWEITLT